MKRKHKISHKKLFVADVLVGTAIGGYHYFSVNAPLEDRLDRVITYAKNYGWRERELLESFKAEGRKFTMNQALHGRTLGFANEAEETMARVAIYEISKKREELFPAALGYGAGSAALTHVLAFGAIAALSRVSNPIRVGAFSAVAGLLSGAAYYAVISDGALREMKGLEAYHNSPPLQRVVEKVTEKETIQEFKYKEPAEVRANAQRILEVRAIQENLPSKSFAFGAEISILVAVVSTLALAKQRLASLARIFAKRNVHTIPAELLESAEAKRERPVQQPSFSGTTMISIPSSPSTTSIRRTEDDKKALMEERRETERIAIEKLETTFGDAKFQRVWSILGEKLSMSILRDVAQGDFSTFNALLTRSKSALAANGLDANQFLL